jgi:hypothetical protein
MLWWAAVDSNHLPPRYQLRDMGSELGATVTKRPRRTSARGNLMPSALPRLWRDALATKWVEGLISHRVPGLSRPPPPAGLSQRRAYRGRPSC